MRTARLLTVSQHALIRGVCIPACTGWGCVSQYALGKGCLPGGCLPRGCLPRVWGVCPGVVSAWGVSAQGVSAHGGVADTPLWTEKGRSDAYLRGKYILWSKGNSIGYWFVDVNAFALTSVYFLQRWFTEDAGRQWKSCRQQLVFFS